MESSSPTGTAKNRYGPASWAAALVNIFAMEVITWLFLPWTTFLSFFFVSPVLVVDLVPAIVLATRPGKLGQVGRGMLIGWISAPVSMTLYSVGYVIVRAVGPI